MNDFHIRTMSRGEVDWAVEMAAREGWNPGLRDAEPFYAQDPDGFLVGLLAGEPVGCISAVSYGGVFGFIGFYIVKPELRGKGYGIQLWRAAMDRLKRHAVIGLDSVFEQQEQYCKSGFVFQYSNIRFEHRNALSHARESATAAVRPLTAADLSAVAEYERDMFPARRDAFLRSWLAQPSSFALAAYGQDSLTGYGVIRPCRVGYKIGPLFADRPETAEALFRGLCTRVEEGARIYLDVPEVNKRGMALAQEHGMKKVFGTARMYAGPSPSLYLKRIFGVTSFELG